MKCICKLLVVIKLVIICGGNSWAQETYPNRPINLIAPYSAGGDSDLGARTFAAYAQSHLGQPVAVLNKPGASGVIGSDFVRRAAPDGYTLLLARPGSQAILPALSPETTKYKWNDFTIIGIIELNPYGCAVRKDAPYKNFDEFVIALKARGEKLNYGTAGIATTNDMGPRLLFSLLNLGDKVPQQIPFKGTGEATSALLSGQIDFACASIGTMLSLIKDGQLRALMVTTPSRYKELPDVPTVNELGFPDMSQITGWSGIYAPPGLSKPVMDKLVQSILDLEKNTNWRSATEKIGSVPYVKVSKEADDFAKSQYETYLKLGTRLNLINKVN